MIRLDTLQSSMQDHAAWADAGCIHVACDVSSICRNCGCASCRLLYMRQEDQVHGADHDAEVVLEALVQEQGQPMCLAQLTIDVPLIWHTLGCKAFASLVLKLDSHLQNTGLISMALSV